MALQSSCGCNILHKVVERRSPACSSTCNDHVQHHRRQQQRLPRQARRAHRHGQWPPRVCLHFLHSHNARMRVRRDIAIDITESVQLLVRFNALRSMPVMPKLEHYNQNAMRSMAAAALATQAAAANARARPRLAGQCEKWLARPNTQRAKPVLGRPTALALPAHAPAQLPARTPTHARKRGLVRFAQNVRTFSPQVRVHARAVRRVERTV